MSFRARLLLLFSVAIVITVSALSFVVILNAKHTFERMEQTRVQGITAQFQNEFDRRARQVGEEVHALAKSDEMLRAAVELSRPDPEYAPWVQLASRLNSGYGLDVLSVLSSEGKIISSVHAPATFGYRDPLFGAARDWANQAPFLAEIDLPGAQELAVVDVAEVRTNDSLFYVLGGEKVDAGLLSAITLPAGNRVLLWSKNGSHDGSWSGIDSQGKTVQFPSLPFIDDLSSGAASMSFLFHWSNDAADDENIVVLPLRDLDGKSLGAFLIGSSRRALIFLERRILWNSLAVGGAVFLVGVILSAWTARRVTRPLEYLAAAADRVAGGEWNTHVETSSRDELGKLADSFNRMTSELLAQRERLVQSERVAAWRELARRLAHELKNPLFPLQITVENLQRARTHYPDQFDEVFSESMTTLLAEISNLKSIIGRFSDFSKMPAPELQTVNLNALLRETVKLFAPQLAAKQPKITASMELSENVTEIEADPVLLRRVLENLILNAIDAMPDGGTLTLRTGVSSGVVSVEVSDTGVGLTPEERERIFTPYYTSKQHGTGLGLAIAQSVVSDHQGTISVRSEPGKGTTFEIQLPERRAEVPATFVLTHVN